MPMIRRTSRDTAGPEVTLTHAAPVRKRLKPSKEQRRQPFLSEITGEQISALIQNGIRVNSSSLRVLPPRRIW